MKKSLMLVGLLCASMFLTGCGNKADENKTPEQIKQEVLSMNVDDIKAMIETYKKAIEAKTAELKVQTEKLSKIPLTEILGDEAKKCKDGIAEVTASLSKLEKNMQAYIDGLNSKK